MNEGEKMMELVQMIMAADRAYTRADSAKKRTVTSNAYRKIKTKLQAMADEYAVLKFCYSPDKVCKITGKPE